MNKKAQTLIVSLWILVILTILAVSIGHRVSMALRISRYQRDKFKALYLARSGLNWTIVELEKDDPNYDNLNDSWSNNEEKFKKIAFDDKENDYATVSYETIDENNEPKTIYGVIDEEKKININTMPLALLVKLLEKNEVLNASEIANNICAWRGDTNINIPDYKDLGYSNKGSRFINKEELLLVKDVNQEIYDKLKYLITIWGYGKVNINTTAKEILEILIDYCIKELEKRNVTDRNPEDLIETILQLRGQDIFFTSFADLEQKLGDLPNHSGPRNILNVLYPQIDFKSSCFYIISTGKINNNRSSDINCIFDRYNKKILYWHES